MANTSKNLEERIIVIDQKPKMVTPDPITTNIKSIKDQIAKFNEVIEKAQAKQKELFEILNSVHDDKSNDYQMVEPLLSIVKNICTTQEPKTNEVK